MAHDPRLTILRNLGEFIDLDGNRREEPSSPVLVVAGLWEDMPKGAMQEQCRICERLVGVAPRTQQMLAENKVLFIVCVDCWGGLQRYRAEGIHGLQRWIETEWGKK